MLTSRVSIAAVALALSLLLVPVAQAGVTDQIKIAPRGQVSPEGWALVTITYSCAPRAGTTTYLDYAVIQPETSSFDDLSGPLTCNGRTNKVVVISGADLDPYRFVPGAARVEASFWNDVLGHWNYPTGFGPRVSAMVTLR